MITVFGILKQIKLVINVTLHIIIKILFVNHDTIIEIICFDINISKLAYFL